MDIFVESILFKKEQAMISLHGMADDRLVFFQILLDYHFSYMFYHDKFYCTIKQIQIHDIENSPFGGERETEW